MSDGKEVRPNLIPTKYKGYYLDHDGDVWSTRNRNGESLCKLKPRISRGYKYFSLYLETGVKNIFQHTLICTANHGERPSARHQVRHLDGDRANNHPSNLAWGTQKENEADKIAHGRKVFGNKHGRSILKDTDLPEINSLREKGWTYERIGNRFGVHFTTIYKVMKKINWKQTLETSRNGASSAQS